MAQARSQSVDVIEDEEQRWIRGVVEIDGDTEMSVRTNSRERFEGLLHAFRTHSDGVEVVEQTSFDPSLDLPPISPAAGGNLSAEAMKAWEKQWLDSGVPALGGATPRIAARRMPLAGHLEALLRGFEFQAALAQRSGGVGPRVDRLRKDLKLPAETWIRPRPW